VREIQLVWDKIQLIQISNLNLNTTAELGPFQLPVHKGISTCRSYKANYSFSVLSPTTMVYPSYKNTNPLSQRIHFI